MTRRRLVPLLLLVLVAALTALWLLSGPESDAPEGGEITRAPEDGNDTPPVLRGAPGARASETDASAALLDPEVVARTTGPVSGRMTNPPKRLVPPSKAVEPFAITGTTRDPKTGDVHLRVVDDRGNPRPGVRARISAKGEDGTFSMTHETVLDASGETALEGVRPGTAYLWLNVGRATHHIRIRVEGGRITEVDFEFPVGVVVEGLVRHAEKGPLAGIRVKLDSGESGKEGHFNDTSDSEGRYRLEGVPKGTHKVSLTGRAIGFHPRSKAQLVIEADEGVVEHDFVLGLVGIGGTVRDASTGRPLPDVGVDVAGLYAQGTTDAAGGYALVDIPPGMYRLYFTKDGYARGRSGEIEVAVDGTTTFDLALDPASVILFHVRTPEGTPVPAVGRARFRVAPKATGTADSARLVADETGQARYERILPGTYDISFDLDAYTAEEVRVVVGPGVTDVEVVCISKEADGPPSLRGVIRDATTREAIGGVRVAPNRGIGNPAVSNASGEYVFSRLTPGSHSFWLTKDGFGIFLARGIEVKAGETTEHDVLLQPAGTLRIHATDARGNPVVGRMVLSIHPRKGTEGTRVGTSTTADAQGLAVYRRIVPGSYRIGLSAGDTGRGSVEADVGLGETTVHVRLE